MLTSKPARNRIAQVPSPRLPSLLRTTMISRQLAPRRYGLNSFAAALGHLADGSPDSTPCSLKQRRDCENSLPVHVWEAPEDFGGPCSIVLRDQRS